MNLENSKFQDIPWDDISSFGQKTMLDNPLFSVSWILGRFCNYNCSYCWPYARSDKIDHYELSLYKRTIDEIKTQARSNGFTDFHFSFSGGEPTAYKDFLNLIDHYTNDTDTNYQSFHMTSNCSPGLKWWKRLVDKLSILNRASITASFHSEFANEVEFSEKLIFLIENNIYVTINQVMVPDKFYEYYDRCKRFYELGIPVTLKPQSNNTATEIVQGYTNEMLDIMQIGFPQYNKQNALYQIELKDSNGNKYEFDQAERFNAFGFNKFKGWECSSGYQSIIIRGNEVKRSYSCKDLSIGNIETGFKIFNQPRLCLTDTCISSADSKIPKKRSKF
jgi:organic radical activating enzyme